MTTLGSLKSPKVVFFDFVMLPKIVGYFTLLSGKHNKLCFC